MMLRRPTDDCLQAIPSNFFSQKLCELVVECVLNPSSVGFDVTDVEVAEHLPSKVLCLFSTICWLVCTIGFW